MPIAGVAAFGAPRDALEILSRLRLFLCVGATNGCSLSLLVLSSGCRLADSRGARGPRRRGTARQRRHGASLQVGASWYVTRHQVATRLTNPSA